MTGPVASIGEQLKRGAETAAAAINETGGVDGRKIAEKYKGKKIAILHDKSAYGKGLAHVRSPRRSRTARRSRL